MYLFISRNCPHSVRLIEWLGTLMKAGRFDGAALKVVDIETLPCKGITRRLGSVPSLIINDHPSVIEGIRRIQETLVSKGLIRRDTGTRPRAVVASGLAPPRPTQSFVSSDVTAGSIREQKSASLDRDLESFISSRQAIGIPLTRVG